MLPLALAQAAGFLAETGMPVDRYLALLKTRAEELLDQSPPQSHPHSLAAAIRLSTDRLADVDPAALALVRIGAFLAPEPIPADVLTRPIPATGDSWPPELAALIAAVVSPVAAHRSLGRVGSYGLARIDCGLHLHRLTQAILRDQLTADHTAAYRAYAQAPLVEADLGGGRDPAYWPGWARMLPHLLAADPATSPSADLRDLACRTAWYLHNRGDIHPARDLAEHLHRQWREWLGPDDPHTLRVAHILVRLLVDVGPYSQACQLGEDTLARCRRVLGDDHIDVHRTAHNLARDLRELGEVEAARQLHDDTFAQRRRMLGDEHPYTIATANELGRDLHALGQVDEARQLHEDSFARARRVLGDESHFTMDVANSLATSLQAVGELEAARQLSEDTLAQARRVFGDNHPRTRKAADNLATALRLLTEAKPTRQGNSGPVDES